MDGQPTFDAARSAAMKTMLMRVAAEHTTPPRTKRVALIASLTVGALLIAGGGAAWAITGMPLFSAPAPAPAPITQSPTPTPTPAPTSTPTPTPSPTIADPGHPYSSVPADCTALADRSGLNSLISDLKLTDISWKDAGMFQTGVLDCWWFNSGLELLVSTDTATGGKDITDQRKIAASNPQIGDVSALFCIQPGDCSVSAVSGAYWLIVRATGGSDATSSTLATRAARGFVAALAQTPQPRAPWTALPSSWSTVKDCSALTTDPPIPQLLDSPSLTAGPERNQGTEDSISFHETQTLGCVWSPPYGVAVPPEKIRSVSVSITPGAVWAYPPQSGTRVTVDGAQDATFVCGNPEAYCYLDVLSDNALLGLSFDESTPDHLDELKALAAALIAAHSR